MTTETDPLLIELAILCQFELAINEITGRHAAGKIDRTDALTNIVTVVEHAESALKAAQLPSDPKNLFADAMAIFDAEVRIDHLCRHGQLPATQLVTDDLSLVN